VLVTVISRVFSFAFITGIRFKFKIHRSTNVCYFVLVGQTVHVACMGEESKVYKFLVGKPKGKRPLERPGHMWEDGIRMDLREIGLGGVNWIRLAQDRGQLLAVVSAAMNLQVLVPRIS
jgi:hypothetical protein